MIIREATLKDIPLIAELAQKTYTDTFGHTMSQIDLKKVLETRSEKYFHSIFKKDTILVAEDNKNIIGFIQFGQVSNKDIQANETDIELKKIYINKNNQGQGIGKQLIEAMLKHNRLVNIKNVYLDVFTENIKAIGLYKKYGFKIIGKTPFKAGNKIVGYDSLMKKVNITKT